MMLKGLIVSSFATLAIALGGSVFADSNEGPGAPSSVKEPVSDPAKQAKTEQMLKAIEPGVTGDQGNPVPAEVKEASPDAAKQAKTEQMLKAIEPGVTGDQGNPVPSEVK